MLFKSWFVAGFAAVAAAQYSRLERRDQAIAEAMKNLPTTKASLTVLKNDLQGLDKLVKGITAENAASKLTEINTYMKKMNEDAVQQTTKLSKSGEIGIGEILGILNQSVATEWITLLVDIFQAANSTLADFGAKRDIIKASGKAESIAEGLKLQKQTVVVIYKSALTQFPSIIKGFVGLSAPSKSAKSSSSSSAKSSTPMINLADPYIVEALGSVLDQVFDQTISWLSGKTEAFSMPTLPARPDAPAGGAAAPSAPEPAAAPAPPKGKGPGSSAPKSKGTPKGTGKGKGSGTGKGTWVVGAYEDM